MCEYCLHSPHLPGCPNAPEPIPLYICESCKEGIFEGDQYYEAYRGYLCKECLEDMTALDLLEFEGEDMTIAETDYDH